MENPPRLAHGRGGKVLSLTGHGGMVRTNWPGIAGDAPRTVSFWTRVEPEADLSQLPAIVSWGQPKILCGKWKLLLFQEAAGKPAYPRISFGAIAFDAMLPVNDGHWHHCVMTFTGKMKTDGTPEVSIHVDGQKQALTSQTYDPTNEMSSFQPDTITGEDSQPFTIGRFLTDGPAQTFIGQIDDVRVYAGVLPEDILLKQAQEKE